MTAVVVWCAAPMQLTTFSLSLSYWNTRNNIFVQFAATHSTYYSATDKWKQKTWGMRWDGKNAAALTAFTGGGATSTIYVVLLTEVVLL